MSKAKLLRELEEVYAVPEDIKMLSYRNEIPLIERRENRNFNVNNDVTSYRTSYPIRTELEKYVRDAPTESKDPTET